MKSINNVELNGGFMQQRIQKNWIDHLPDTIRAILREKQLSITEASLRTGKGSNFLSKMIGKRGKKRILPNLPLVSMALDVPEEDIIIRAKHRGTACTDQGSSLGKASA